jgi:hypothetical protein
VIRPQTIALTATKKGRNATGDKTSNYWEKATGFKRRNLVQLTEERIGESILRTQRQSLYPLATPPTGSYALEPY